MAKLNPPHFDSIFQLGQKLIIGGHFFGNMILLKIDRPIGEL